MVMQCPSERPARQDSIPVMLAFDGPDATNVDYLDYLDYLDYH